jgi:tetratricopeptide (TPR) repeat protein
MRRLSWVSVILLVISIQALQAQSRMSARDFLKRGTARYSKGDVDHAIEDFSTALDMNPRFTEALLARSEAFRIKGDFDSAIMDFERAVELDSRLGFKNPSAASAYTTRGSLRANSFDLEGAVADFDKAVKYNPGSADIYVKRAEAYLLGEEFSLAIRDFSDGLLLHPSKIESSLALAGRGYAHLLNGDDHAAASDFAESIEINKEGKFLLMLHLRLLESKLREARKRKSGDQQLVAYLTQHLSLRPALSE